MEIGAGDGGGMFQSRQHGLRIVARGRYVHSVKMARYG
jgi:hypothetical protein